MQKMRMEQMLRVFSTSSKYTCIQMHIYMYIYSCNLFFQYYRPMLPYNITSAGAVDREFANI